MPNDEPVKGLASGLRVLRAPDYVKSEKYIKQQWQATRDGADERIVTFARKFVVRMENLGVPMFPHVFVRSREDQQVAFDSGVSRAKPGQSPHQYGLAVDIVHGIKAWDLSRESWALIGHIGKEIATQNGLKVVWGGDFKSIWDPAHWELADWRDIAGIR